MSMFQMAPDAAKPKMRVFYDAAPYREAYLPLGLEWDSWHGRCVTVDGALMVARHNLRLHQANLWRARKVGYAPEVLRGFEKAVYYWLDQVWLCQEQVKRVHKPAYLQRAIDNYDEVSRKLGYARSLATGPFRGSRIRFLERAVAQALDHLWAMQERAAKEAK
jgi:hypothetical protein